MNSTHYFLMVTVGASASFSALVHMTDPSFSEAKGSQFYRGPANTEGNASAPATPVQVQLGSGSSTAPGASGNTQALERLVDVKLDGNKFTLRLRQTKAPLRLSQTQAGLVLVGNAQSGQDQISYSFGTVDCKSCESGAVLLPESSQFQLAKAQAQDLEAILAAIYKDIQNRRAQRQERETFEKQRNCQGEAELASPPKQMQCLVARLNLLGAEEAKKPSEKITQEIESLIGITRDLFANECTKKKDKVCYEMILKARQLHPEHPVRKAAEARSTYIKIARAAEMAGFDLRDFRAELEQQARHPSARSPMGQQALRAQAALKAKILQEQLLKNPDLDVSKLKSALDPLWGVRGDEAQQLTAYVADTYNAYAPLTGLRMKPFEFGRPLDFGRERLGTDAIAELGGADRMGLPNLAGQPGLAGLGSPFSNQPNGIGGLNHMNPMMPTLGAPVTGFQGAGLGRGIGAGVPLVPNGFNGTGIGGIGNGFLGNGLGTGLMGNGLGGINNFNLGFNPGLNPMMGFRTPMLGMNNIGSPFMGTPFAGGPAFANPMIPGTISPFMRPMGMGFPNMGMGMGMMGIGGGFGPGALTPPPPPVINNPQQPATNNNTGGFARGR